MISNELIEEYLYDILGKEFKYNGYAFQYFEIILEYYNNRWYFICGESYPEKLNGSDIKVWLRKKKLEKICL
jgi:hypothetical protein